MGNEWYEDLADELGHHDWREEEFGDGGAAAHGGRSWGPGWSSVQREGNGLVRITVLHGTVVDVDYPPVRGSKFEHLDQRLLPRRAAPPIPMAPQPPEHELKLTWLEAVAGGAEALAVLDDSPLVPEAEPDLAQLSWPVRTRLERILARIDEYAPSLLGPEGAIVARRLAVRAVSARPTVLSTSDRDQANVGAIIHAAGKGNDLVGPGKWVLAKDIQAECGLSSSPSQRARNFADAVSGGRLDWPSSWMHRETPAVIVLGSPDLLVSDFRRILIAERDLALRLRAVTPASA
ncbi:hypothetical protein BN10_470018 [Phycicoccus elongatus Lp2]|uniref:Uncharacterized protein n=1 Tax=Phycicoccus elongatus Lp2 TaxID=1193181 RepID=N0DZB4_9MICO|nr:hypothetical protein [Phycicoccus elongatus]CCH69983.1 hypothetical protein BN10_470018 [Phycicoccus elongatus Lp2]